MKAYITSIGERTTALCYWSLKRLDFEPIIIRGKDTKLWEKLRTIYYDTDEDFLRVDADTICNSNVIQLIAEATTGPAVWYQPHTFDWFKQDLTYGGVQYICKEALPILRRHVKESKYEERPETYLSRVPEFFNPRTFVSSDLVCGLHGYKQKNKSRVEETKKRRGQWGDYDFELAYMIESLK